MRKTLLAFALLTVSLTAVAQQAVNVRNPSAVEFTVSPDHANVDSYELDILKADGSVVQTLNIGKPTPDATGTARAPINVQPTAFGKDYSTRLRAIAAGAQSDYAPSENKFDRVPGAPSKLNAK